MKDRAKHPFQQLFRNVLGLFLVFALCFFLFQYQREKRFGTDKLNSLLLNYNDMLHKSIDREGLSAQTVDAFLLNCPQTELRVTIVDPSGKVFYDTEKHGEMENHAAREEILAAQRDGSGFAIRMSKSTNKKYFYSAKAYGDYVFRTSLPYDHYVEQLLRIDKKFIYFMMLIAALMVAILYHYTSSLNRIIYRLRLFADRAERNEPIGLAQDEFPDDDLGDISQHIIGLYRNLQQAKDALIEERRKIIKHFQYSTEGFAMFDADRREILSNRFFIQYLNVLSIGSIKSAEDALQTEELMPLNLFVQAMHGDFHFQEQLTRERMVIDRNGKIFQVECIVFKDRSFEISINDITAQEHEKQLKKQLTQNIAHELKTPVSSIRGFLELILTNPEMDPLKRADFLIRSYAQTERLTLLLKDISLLNSLDESKKMFDLRGVDLQLLLNELAGDSAPALEQKNMHLNINLPMICTVLGNYSLLYSIFRNLLDNTINYSGDDTKVLIDCYREDEEFYYFRFADDGIGVGNKHINRIFERFYRVDKGRSRKSGGTGLGLAIVKNAVLFHQGNITAKSGAKGGLEFLFTLKKNVGFSDDRA